MINSTKIQGGHTNKELTCHDESDQQSGQQSWVSPPSQLAYAKKTAYWLIKLLNTTKDVSGSLAVHRIYFESARIARILLGTSNDPFRLHKPSIMWRLKKKPKLVRGERMNGLRRLRRSSVSSGMRTESAAMNCVCDCILIYQQPYRYHPLTNQSFPC